MFRNQYIVVPSTIKSNLPEFNRTDFVDMHIYAHSKLNVSIVKSDLVQIGLIGYVINPLNPIESNNDIICRISKDCSTTDEFFEEIQTLSGRYILIYKKMMLGTLY